MLVAAAVEAYRKSRAPPPAFFPTVPNDTAALEYLQGHISACRSLDDYDPFHFQDWWTKTNGGGASAASDPAPANCRQVGPPLPDGTLPLASIACDSVPLVRGIMQHSDLFLVADETTPIHAEPYGQQSSPVSVFWQIPQFLLVGVSEILTSVTCAFLLFRKVFALCVLVCVMCGVGL